MRGPRIFSADIAVGAGMDALLRLMLGLSQFPMAATFVGAIVALLATLLRLTHRGNARKQPDAVGFLNRLRAHLEFPPPWSVHPLFLGCVLMMGALASPQSPQVPPGTFDSAKRALVRLIAEGCPSSREGHGATSRPDVYGAAGP